MRPIWNPLRELEALRNEIDRVFEGWSSGEGPSTSAFLPGRAARRYPLMNVSEDEEAVYVDALAPGLDTDSLDVSLQSNILTVSGRKKSMAEEEEPQTYHREERAAGNFSRTLRLDFHLDRDEVSAEYSDGILHVTLPKAEEARPKKVDVKVQ